MTHARLIIVLFQSAHDNLSANRHFKRAFCRAEKELNYEIMNAFQNHYALDNFFRIYNWLSRNDYGIRIQIDFNSDLGEILN